MRITRRDLKLIIVLAGIAIFAVLYFFVNNMFITKTEEVKTEISILTPEVQALRDSQENFESYVSETERYKQEIENELYYYPSKIQPEEFLVWALEWRDTTGVEISDVSLSPETIISQFECYAPQIIDGAQQNVLSDVSFGTISLNASAQMTYNQLKNSITAIYNYRNPTVLNSVTVSYDAELAKLTGTYSISKYFISYENAPYAPLDMPNVALGNEDIFGYTAVEQASEPVDEAQ